jgi:16S rRNA (uracil1498-N3)-methyltransferase
LLRPYISYIKLRIIDCNLLKLSKSYQRLAIDPTQKENEKIRLTSQQNHYLSRVLRLKNGDRLIAMDGLGKSWLVELQDHAGSILEPIIVETELSVNLTLMIALPKGNGFDDLIRSCTELGVTTFIPVISDRTLLKPSAAKVERWTRIAKEAAEQSERQIIPTILEPQPFKKAIIEQNNPENQQLICVARGNYPHLLTYLQQPRKDVIVVTGPEGGWTEGEIEQAIAANFKPVSLGKTILRAVTAPIMVSSLVNAVINSY